KQYLVKEVFDSVAGKYDLMNDFMSLGMHRLWKQQFIKILNPVKNKKLIDVAGGTGDIAFQYLDHTKDNGSNVTICDINQSMLSVGKTRANNKSFSNINWLTGNAEALPFQDKSFDYYTIAFGIRNVTNIDQALNEANRVLKVGGKFCCLEFSNVNNAILKKFYDKYSLNIIPKIGKFIARDADSYQYLVESIRQFPNQEKFKLMLEQAGFSKSSYINLSGGIVAIHYGWRVK
ncbi:MAG: bifunctional demethylmenaquinone methyltransferase/2-methoxy-6-polyprenyl-1,4-benzoquinol methylase UbiE, partial [Pseudomonadota bacterium]